MIQRILRLVYTAALVAGGLVLFFTLIECLRAYTTLRDVHPMLGTVFGIAVLVGIAVLLVWYVVTIGRRPGVLLPPAGVNPETATGAPLRAFARYQIRLLRRLSENPSVEPARRETARRQSERLREALAAGSHAADLSLTVRHATEHAIAPVLEPLDALARTEVARSVRDVMLGVTLSPWRTADLLVVLYRNLRMTARVMEIYNTRPPLREQVLILRDVFTVVATVNFLSYGSQLFQTLTASVPVLGRFADDVAEGIGAGVLTSVTGHAAIGRCRTYGCWNASDAQRSIRANLGRFLADVKHIVIDDVLHRLRKPVEAQLPAAQRPANVEETMRVGVVAAMDASASFLDQFVVRPVAATGRGVVDTGAAVGRVVARGSQATGRAIAQVASGTTRWIAGAGRVTAQTLAGALPRLHVRKPSAHSGKSPSPAPDETGC